MIPQLGLSGLNGTFPSLNAVEFVNGVPNMCAAPLHHDQRQDCFVILVIRGC